MLVDRLRKRRDFLAAAKARRAGVGPFLIQGRDRADAGDVRFGLTVTRKTGNAVVRNRIRRRLREVARQVLPEAGRAGHDYVLVARAEALKAPFATLVTDLKRGIAKLHDANTAARGQDARNKDARSKDARGKGLRSRAPRTKEPQADAARPQASHVKTPPAPHPPAPPVPPAGSKPPPTEADRHE